MHSFYYKNSNLHCEDINLQELAHRHDTPTFVYSSQTMLDHYRRLDEAFSDLPHSIHYAVKANSNLAILQKLVAAGASFDIVSGGELQRVMMAGGGGSDCTFAGVGKTVTEIAEALDRGIHCFNVESPAELETINSVASDAGLIAPVALRVNPNVDAGTHEYISTGKSENKFGIDFEEIEPLCEKIATELPQLKLIGLQMHIGSQLTSIEPFLEAVKKITPLAAKLKEKYSIKFLSIGGGLGIVYDEALESGNIAWWYKKGDSAPLSFDKYAKALKPLLQPLGLHIMLEPGRVIVGNAGVLLTKILYIKKGRNKNFVIVDAAMNDLLRPALYSGQHEIIPAVKKEQTSEKESRMICDIVGPICETGDFLAKDRAMPELHEGDILAVMSAGAYGASMGSNYNSRPLPTEILIDGKKEYIARRRQTFVDMIATENLLTT